MHTDHHDPLPRRLLCWTAGLTMVACARPLPQPPPQPDPDPPAATGIWAVPPSPFSPSVAKAPPGPLRPVMPYMGGAVLPGYHLEQRPRTALLLSGVGMFTLFYAITALVSVETSALGLIPIAGPLYLACDDDLLSSDPGRDLAVACGRPTRCSPRRTRTIARARWMI